ncbi:T9SS type A sorting domain-containing protein [Larkinella punicea]|uniref:Secretion system C-terminal sorting domain-containing protein n=1 Tax=Larkinella punicea TaxID=2315727 RepID=A0A368JGE4_9BACT|nr:T9SS type A sorting domain-containing protein [Larkinella punicea]RCR66727.1 hypothetical protein DUE52_25875 [Larkinella punicea]
MKTLSKSLLVAFLLTLTSVSFAKADVYMSFVHPKKPVTFQSSLFTTTEGKLRIALNKQTGGAVQVRIVNRAGAEVFSKQIGKNRQNARLQLDVRNLPDGVYQVSITNGVDTTTQELTLATTPPVTATPRLIAFQ